MKVAALAAAALVAPASPAATADIRISDLAANPNPPQASAPFEVAGRILLSGNIGSIHCRVTIGERRYRNIRLTWDGSTARCAFVIPAAARGRQLSVRLVARQGGNRAATTLRFRVG